MFAEAYYMSHSSAYRVFLYWLITAGIVLFAIYVSWDLGVLAKIFAEDITRISLIVIALLLLTSLHCGYRSWYLTQQLRMAEVLSSRLAQHDDSGPSEFSPGASVIQDYLSGIKKSSDERDKVILSELMAEKVRGSHQVGWFISGLVIKLGLLGTVIGFVLMLGSVSGLENLDISDIKQLMQQMTQGMGVAMNTTLVGLVSSMLLGIQYLLLDRCADGVVAIGVEIGQQLCADSST